MDSGPRALEMEQRRVSRQRLVMIGLGLTILGAFVLLLAPDLTGPFVQDLPFLAVALAALYTGGILMGFAYGRRVGRRGA